jgi:hypothetical protein
VKGIVGIVPWAVVVALGGGAIWWMLSSDVAAGRWLLAAVLVGHGVVHLMFGIPAPAPTANGPAWPFDMARSWAVRAGLDLGLARGVGLVLIAVVVGGFALAALSTVGVVVPSGWWQPAVAVAAVASTVVLTLFFEPQLVLGHGIDIALLGLLATGAWAP